MKCQLTKKFQKIQWMTLTMFTVLYITCDTPVGGLEGGGGGRESSALC